MSGNHSKPTTPSQPPVVFAFMDHREFLRRWYEWKKATSRGFSYRYFAQKAGFSSMSFLRDVIEGRRNISDDSCEKFISVIGLVEDAAEYFQCLVEHERVQEPEARQSSFRNLLLLQARRAFTPVSSQQEKYYADWLNVIVREMAPLPRFRGDVKQMAQALRPPMPVEQVQASLELLLELELLRRNDDGTFAISTPRLVPGDVSPQSVRNIKRQMLLHALERLEDGPLPDTHISSVTLTMSRERLADVTEKVRQFRLNLLADTASDSAPLEQVVQINVQLIPFLRAPQDDPN